MAEIYTREQIVRKLRRLRDKRVVAIKKCCAKRDGMCYSCIDRESEIDGLNAAISAFMKKGKP